MSLRHAAPLLQLRAQPEGRIVGYGSAFDTIDSFAETVLPGAFTASLRKHAERGTKPVMLWSHRADEPIGRWEQLTEDKRGLLVEGQLNLQTSAGREAHEHLRAGDLNGLSVGFVPIKAAQRADGITELREVDLVEVSVVALPANPQARITSVRARCDPPASVRELEAALRDMGFSRREAAAIAHRGFPAIDDPDPTAEHLQALQAALDRAITLF